MVGRVVKVEGKVWLSAPHPVYCNLKSTFIWTKLDWDQNTTALQSPQNLNSFSSSNRSRIVYHQSIQIQSIQSLALVESVMPLLLLLLLFLPPPISSLHVLIFPRYEII